MNAILKTWLWDTKILIFPGIFLGLRILVLFFTKLKRIFLQRYLTRTAKRYYLFCFFFDAKKGKYLMHITWDKHPLKSPSSQAIRLHPGKTKSYEPKALNETMLPIRRKKIITISRTQQRTTPNSTPFQPKRNNGDMSKRGDPH